VPSVRLNANYLRPGSDPSNIRNWEIQVRPGPDFPQRIYSAENVGCTATDSFMAVVLGKTTLAPDSSIAVERITLAKHALRRPPKSPAS
jgi:hypothetical protein